MKCAFLLFSILFIASGLQAQWEQLNNSSVTTRHHPVTFTLDNTAYLLSGTTPQSNPFGTNNFYRYDEENDNWIELDNFPGGARSFAYAATYEGKAYFGFGANGTTYFNDLWKYDPQAESWTELTSCPCRGRAHPAFVAHNGKIYMGMGNDIANLNDWWEYDIESDSWMQRPNLPGDPRHHPFHFQAGNYVYAGMGHAGINFYADWYRYDTDNNSWERMNDHPQGPRVAGQEFSYKNHGFIISGDGDQHLNLPEGEFWKYLHEEDEWVRLPDHPGSPPDGRVGRWAPGSMVLNDFLYFFGGANRVGGFLYSEVHRFDLREVISSVDKLNTDQSIEVYPNPTSDILHLKFPVDNLQNPKVFVTDANGRVVIHESLHGQTFHIGHLPNGLYQLTVSSETRLPLRTSFVKKH
ncbi:MAG: T9SS C-terminal target domain-containing protein [Saprospirales bacterium]|nr:MAG: T9SS C-terminal target domain-containing protein [Saprospirales bacterium]